MDFMTVVYSDVGIKKETNQDSVLLEIADTDCGRVVLSVICDGMGGLSKGEVASATVIKAFNQWFEQEFPPILYGGMNFPVLKQSLQDLLYEQNIRLAEYGAQIHLQLGTTVVALLIAAGNYYIVNIGDSRVYELTDNITQLTKDQTYVQREIDEGRMTEEEARRDPQRNKLLQCVGASAYVVPAFFSGVAKENATYMSCSDGFRHEVTTSELYERLNPLALPDERAMVEQAKYLCELNKYRRETDNISVSLIRTV